MQEAFHDFNLFKQTDPDRSSPRRAYQVLAREYGGSAASPGDVSRRMPAITASPLKYGHCGNDEELRCDRHSPSVARSAVLGGYIKQGAEYRSTIARDRPL
jgi:hypothetical protein